MEQPDSLPSLSILIVSYNTRDLTLTCLESISRHPPSGEYEILVVDNDSSDDSVEAIRRRFPEVRLFETGENLGFAGGNNFAMRESKGDVLVLLNSDTEVHPRALKNLQRAFSEERDLAGACGRLLNSDGTQQFGLRFFPRLSNRLSESLFLHHFFHGPNWSEIEDRPEVYDKSNTVEWASGAYLAVRREWYEMIGGLDRGFFMYSEDVDWCYRIATEGGKIRYVPDSVVTHHGGGSSGGSAKLHIELSRARDRFARLHFSTGKAALYRGLLSFGLLARAALTIPFALVSQKGRKDLGWRLSGAFQVYTHPLPLEPKHD